MSEWLALLVELNEVTGFGHFGLEIRQVVLGRFHDVGDAFVDLDAVLFKAGNLFEVVRHQLDRFHTERVQHVGGDSIVPGVVWKPQCQVGLHRIESLILELICLDLVREADPAAFLTEVQQNAHVHFADGHHGGLKLVAAVAAKRTGNVAGETLRMQSDRDILGAADVAPDESSMFLVVDVGMEAGDLEVTETRRKAGDPCQADADIGLVAAIVLAVPFQEFDDFIVGYVHVRSWFDGG